MAVCFIFYCPIRLDRIGSDRKTSPYFINERDITMGNPLELTVFIACFNEQDGIIQTLATVVEACKTVVPDSWEIIVIDDASTDLSPNLVENFVQQNPTRPIKLIRNDVNQGLAYNVVEAAFKGHGEYFRFIHGGNIEPLSCQIKLLESRKLADIIIELPDDRKTRKPSRRLLSKIFNILVNTITGYKLGYWQGAALHKRYNVMRWHSNTRGHSFLLLLTFQCLEEGCTYKEILVQHMARSKNRRGNSISFPNFCSVLHGLITILLYRLRKALFGK